ncbi:MAG: peptidoglycan-binding protein, partial [Oscillospiraceae bacterium]|nr:peptidoglycan-binding protein [Oscillospiraceae bacterium]
YRGIQQNAPVPSQPPVPPENALPYPGTSLRLGSTGQSVRSMQTYLNVIRAVYPDIPYLVVDGEFGERTEEAVIAFQKQFLLVPDGIIGPITWYKIVEQFLLLTGNASVSLEYPGEALSLGSTGQSVRLIQGFLAELRSRYPSLPPVTVDGIFGMETQTAVIAFQRIMGLVPDGIIGPLTWNSIIQQRNLLVP